MFYITVHSKKPLLTELYDFVTPNYAASWKEIGSQLGIQNGILHSIEINSFTDVGKCCDEMFEEWLNADPTASWGKLIKVIDSPAVLDILNTFTKLPLCIKKELIDSEAVRNLEHKLRERHILTRYRSPHNDWFCEPEHFTSVALIHQKMHRTKRETIAFANMQRKGDFMESEIFPTIGSIECTEVSRITTDISKVFALVECSGHPYTLLIEGAPGIGKTILSKEIVFQWANEKLLNSENLVFLLYLRDPKVRAIDTFESLISYLSYSQVSMSIEYYVSSKSGKGVTLVLDGYDEYPKELRINSFISKVINHDVLELQSCNIIVTSRPSASACLHNNSDLRVEILGFTKQHRKSYITYALKDDPEAIENLLEYLNNTYSVDAYCHIPLSMAILVYLFKEFDYDKSKLPTTQTAINYKFICITIRHFIRKSQNKVLRISNFSEVPMPHKQILFEISKLAFLALEDDKIVFTASEISDSCPSLLNESNVSGLDLLKAVEYSSLEENADELSFNFLHFSVQELLAAYHISMMSNNQQIKLLKDTFWNSSYFNVWIMYVALTANQPFAFKHFLSGNVLQISTMFLLWWSGNTYVGISESMKGDKIKSLHLFQCFAEAGNDDMCRYVGELLQDGTIDLSGQTLSAINLYTLSLFLARSVRKDWTSFDLSNCNLSDEDFEVFYKSYSSLTKSTVNIETINLSGNNITKVSASQLANVILNFNTSQLIFDSNKIEEVGIHEATFAAMLEHPNLAQSMLIEIKDENQAILIFCKKEPAISELFMMCYCAIYRFEDLYSYIKSNSPLFGMLLNASDKSTFETMVHRLIGTMTFFFNDLKFYFRSINLTNEEISSAINSLAYHVPLAVCIGDKCLPLHLYISNDIKHNNVVFNSSGTFLLCGNISRGVMHSLISLLLNSSNLNQIYLNGIVLYDNFINNIKVNCSTLNSLQLVNCYRHYTHGVSRPNSISHILSHMISKSISLEHLNLSSCRFQIEHVKIIFEALKQVVTFKAIVLSENNLTQEVCDILASVITCNTSLQRIELSNCNMLEVGIITLTKALKNVKDLQSLDLSNNVITDEVAGNVATVIEKFDSIKELRLQNSKLQYIGLQRIAKAMVTKTCLKCIDLSHNVICDENALLVASVIVKNKNLQTLNLSNCKMQKMVCQQLFKAIAEISSLLHLDLSNNLCTDVAIGNFALMIYQNVGLKHLNISGCFNKVKNFQIVTKSLIALKSLRYLDLSLNIVNIISVENLKTMITNNVYMESLNLSNCELRKIPLSSILIAMQNNHHLKYLSLHSNSVGIEQAEQIANVISSNPFLEIVDLSNCNLTEVEMKSILLPLRNNNLLKHFDISFNTITNHTVNEIVDVIDANTQLTHLDISDSEIQEYGILKIFKALKRRRTLKCIKLCNCAISDRAAKAIADSISVNSMIEELVFASNNFHKTGIALLFDVLKETCMVKSLTVACSNVVSTIISKVTEVILNNNITHFNLSNCSLESRSCSLITNTLILKAPTLRHIDLSDNNLNGTAKDLAQLISTSYYLQHLNLANTNMQDEEVRIIIKAMQNINSLHYVDLTSYSINDELAMELQNTINKNPAIVSFKITTLSLKNMMSGKNISEVISLLQIDICFSNCETDEVIPLIVSLINNSPFLQYLHIESNKMLEFSITSIIAAIAKSEKLEYFCLVNIMISDEVEDEIVTVVENNIQLKHFKLVGCNVTEKGLTNCIQSFNMTRLSHLKLNNMNNLISCAAKVQIVNSVTHLDLSGVHLNSTKLPYLSLPSLTKLQHINLSDNPITDQGADILSTLIISNKALKHLDLCNCNLQSKGIEAVSYALQKITNIAYLDLSLNEIEDVEVFNNNIMPALLCTLKSMKYFFAPCCEMKEKKIDNLTGLMNKAEHVKYIDLGSSQPPKSTINHFKDTIFVSKGYKEITFSTKGIKQLQQSTYERELSFHYLNINDVVFDDQVENIVVNLIFNSPNLEHLEMARCNLNYSSAIKCFGAFQNQKTLLHLNISGISFTIAQICSLLTGFTALTNLQLSNCVLEDDKIISSFFHHAKLFSLAKLKHLDLSNTFISEDAVGYLTVVIATNVELQYLNICNCNLKPAGIIAIIDTLRMLPFLKSIDLRLNSSEIMDSVALLDRNKYVDQLRLLSNLVLDNVSFNNFAFIKGLEYLHIEGCHLTDEDINTVVSVLSNNQTLYGLHLLNCHMSMRSKITIMNYVQLAAILYMQQLQITVITDNNPESLKCSLDTDMRAVTTEDNIIGELIVSKLILNQSRLQLLSKNNLMLKRLEIFHIHDCTLTNHDAYYVASLISNNATTIQSINLTGCKMSFQGKKMIHKAMCGLDITLLQYLSISNNSYVDQIQDHTTVKLTKKKHCQLTDSIISAVIVDSVNLKTSKLVINKGTLQKLIYSLNLIKGLVYLSIDTFKLDDKDAMATAILISNNRSIQELNIFCSKSTKEKKKYVPITEPWFPSEDDVVTIIMHSIAEHLRNLLRINFNHVKCSGVIIWEIITLIYCNTKLKCIHLCDFLLNTSDIIGIVQAAKMLTTLEHFDICLNIGNVSDTLVSDLASLLIINKNIASLNIPVFLNYKQLCIILNAIRQCTSLTYVDLNIDELSRQSIIDIANMMVTSKLKEFKIKLVLKKDTTQELAILSRVMKFTGVNHIHIEGWRFDKEEINILNEITYSKIIDTVTFSDCVLFETSEIFKLFADLKYLHLNNILLDAVRKDELAIHLMDICMEVDTSLAGETRSITLLKVNKIDFTEELVLNLAYVIRNHSEKLDYFAMIKCNTKKHKFDKLLCEALQECTNIQYLDLSYSLITSQIAVSVLTTNKNLTHLKVFLCDIDINAICDALKTHYNIIYLNLSYNSSVGRSASKLVSIIRNNNQLRYIELKACSFNKDEIIKIRKAAETCTNLHHLDLSD